MRLDKQRSDFIDYSNAPLVRGLISLIPCFGSLIDIKLSNTAANIQNKRIIEFLEYLDKKIKDLKILEGNKEEQYDLFIKTLEASIKTRSSKKKQYYAELLKKGLTVKNANIDFKIELFINILNIYEDIHLLVLKFAYEAPEKDSQDKNAKNKKYKPFQIVQGDPNIPSLHNELSDSMIKTYDMVTISLLSQGLIELGEQTKEFKGRPFGVYKISELGEDFMIWVSS